MEILLDARMVVWPKVAQTKLKLFCVRACCRCLKPFMVKVVDEVIRAQVRLHAPLTRQSSKKFDNTVQPKIDTAGSEKGLTKLSDNAV